MEISLLTFEEFKSAREILYSAMEKADKKLNALCEPARGPMGLISEELRTSSQYREAKGEYDKAFAAVRGFNERHLKTFKKELALERNQKRNGRQSDAHTA